MTTTPIRPLRKRRQMRRPCDIVDLIQRTIKKVEKALPSVELIAFRIAAAIIFLAWIIRMIWYKVFK